MKRFFSLFFLFFIIGAGQVIAQDVVIEGTDTPNDKGGSIDLSWTINNPELAKNIKTILVMRAEADGTFTQIKSLGDYERTYPDNADIKDDVPYFYQLSFQDIAGQTFLTTEKFGPFLSSPQWFNRGKIANLFFAFISMTIILLFIRMARKGKNLYIRHLAGVDAIEDAVGRATEMGKPCIYSPGISVIEDISTLASISILSKISQTVAEYDSRMIVPNYDPVVYSVIDEVVRDAYVKTGRPDAYKSDDVYFLTNGQFAYASGMSGLMAREKPAANFFLGYFMAESLILAEAGSMTGAIQIAGTDSISQIPFFIVACDYTLIGEELYAAGALMGDDPKLKGGIKGQDYVKLVVMLALIVLFALKLFGVSGIDTILGG